MAYTFTAKPNDPTRKHIQYYEMLGTRGLWEDGWKVASVHAPLTGRGKFDQDAWELYHVDVDRSESTDLSKQYPDKVRALVTDWFAEADKNHVLPLDDRSAVEILGLERPSDEPKHDRYIYYPDTAPVPEAVAVNIRNRSYKILANVDITDADASGVIFAHGSRFGGHSLFVKDRKVHYVYNFLGIKPEQDFASKTDLTPGKHTIGVEFTREKSGEHGESIGSTKLYIDGQVVAEGPMRTQPGKFTLSGDGLCVGFDSGDSVSAQYSSPARFKGGKIFGVGVSVEKTQYDELNREAQRLLMSE